VKREGRVSPAQRQSAPSKVAASSALRDALARVIRAIDAIADGDAAFGVQVLDDLAIDLSSQIERLRDAA
jgi:hypothetical protein